MGRVKRAVLAGLLLIAALSPARPGFLAAAGQGGAAAAPAIHLEPVLSGLSSPVFVTSARDGSGRLFVVELGGVIKVLQPGSTTPTVFLDIGDKIVSGGEQGLLGLAFHPDFETNRRFFVDYTRKADGATVIAQYRASAANPDVANPAETVLLVIPQPFANHNGGMLAFGPDGFLYIGMGDGGGANDHGDNDHPGNRAQNLNELLGKILRIDVDHTSGTSRYSSPPGNPFLGVAGRDEIFAYGLRNPWRFSFDRLTGELFVGDVGQGAREEIDLVTVGGNYGWRVREGTICTANDPERCADAGFTDPLVDYDHSNGRCAVTGGYAYRGAAGALPAGTYVFADFCSGEIWRLDAGAMTPLLSSGGSVSSFGEDEAGEIYVVHLSGTVHRIAAVPHRCGYSIAPVRKALGGGAQSGTVHVSAPDGCAWSAKSNVSWASISSGKRGIGSRAVAYAVAGNPSRQPRAGTLTIAGRSFELIQSGADCSGTIAPTMNVVPRAGARGTVTVAAAAACRWTAVSNAPWIVITAGASGIGNGILRYRVVPGSRFRAGTITVAGRVFVVYSL